MKIIVDSVTIGTDLNKRDIIRIEKNQRSVGFGLKIVSPNPKDNIITSHIVMCCQSDENTLLFLTKSNSRYAIIIEESDFENKNSEIIYLKDIMNENCFRPLIYTKLGEKIIFF